MDTLHYWLNPTQNQQTPDNLWEQKSGLIIQANQIACLILAKMNVPYQSHLKLHRQPDQSGNLYGLTITLDGPSTGCEPIEYGWSIQPDYDDPTYLEKGATRPPLTLQNRHFVKTGHAANFLQTHLTAATIIEIWRHHNLITDYQDDLNYLPLHHTPNLSPNEREQERSIIKKLTTIAESLRK